MNNQKIIKSFLTLKAINMMAIEEIENLDQTIFFDNKSQKALSKIIGVLEQSLEKHYDLVREEEIQQAILAISQFLENWTKLVTSLSGEDLLDLDAHLVKFFENRKQNESN